MVVPEGECADTCRRRPEFDDQIADLGESRDSFPQKKLAELIERVSREIFNDTMRARFLDKMEQAVSALQTIRAFS